MSIGIQECQPCGLSTSIETHPKAVTGYPRGGERVKVRWHHFIGNAYRAGSRYGGDAYRRFCAAAVHAAPVFLDRDASISRLEQWAAKAKAAGADLIVFGESYIPAFPLWNMLYAPIDQHAFYCRL